MSLTKRSPNLTPPPVKIKGLHHFAWRCRDAEETRHFYEDIMGLPLAHIIKSDYVPSTGEYCPYVHIFFRMYDGSYMAFFDLGDDTNSLPSPNTPAWVNHIALQVDNLSSLKQVKERMENAGYEVLGITDHHIIESIYFFDPNGLRVELTTPIASSGEMAELSTDARAQLDEWSKAKKNSADRLEAHA
jgi:catechol 2,3-dioxygenase-like lactoylglutathione lyase family enzyme